MLPSGSRVTCSVTGDGPVGRQLISTMSDPTAGQCSSISQHLRETKKVLQGVVFNAKYVWSVKIRCVRLTLKFTASRRPWMQLRLNDQQNGRVDCN